MEFRELKRDTASWSDTKLCNKIDKYLVVFIVTCSNVKTRLWVEIMYLVLLYFSITVKAATLIFISGCGSAISSVKEGKSGFIYNLVKS